MAVRAHAWKTTAIFGLAITMAGAFPTVAVAGTDPVSTEASAGVTHAQNPRVPDGAVWTEAYFPSSMPSTDGGPVEMHADVLRPAHLGPDEPTPVIMSIGPYFSHSGQTVTDTQTIAGPSTRFSNLVDGARLMERGYTFVYVDLRGFGGSTGCVDLLGPGEQADVVSAVEWAASQPWSTGAVGLYGKSYDGSTGLVGVNHQPDGLRAVVAQEPAWSERDYLLTNGISRPQQVLTPQSYIETASFPGISTPYTQDGYDVPADTERYRANAAYEISHPECASGLMADTQEMDPQGEFWRVRDLPAHVDGSTVPLMLTQGLTEQNTKPEGMQQYLAGHAGELRSWIGPWDHVRGDEVDDRGRYKMGRSTWLDEVGAFYDTHLKGEGTSTGSRQYIQDIGGTWREQRTWPEPTTTYAVPLTPGSYLDTGRGSVEAEAAPDATPTSPPNVLQSENGAVDPDEVDIPDDLKNTIVTYSRPVRTDVRLTGTPVVELRTRGAGNVLVAMFDVAPDRTTVLANVNVSRLDPTGTTSFGMLAMDWTLEAGHSLLVTVGTVESGWWEPIPSDAEVEVTGATLTLDLQSTRHDVPAAGDPAPFIDDYLRYFTLDGPAPAFTTSFTLSVAAGSISLDRSEARAGEEMVVTGTGYDPDAAVRLHVGEHETTTTADADGSFRSALTVPADAIAGDLEVVAIAENGDRQTARLMIVRDVSTPSPTVAPSAVSTGGASSTRTLAATGGRTDGMASLVALSAAAIAVGAALLVRRRIRSGAGRG
jgi:uncharacterized protein